MNVNARDFTDHEVDSTPIQFRHKSASAPASKQRRPSFGRRGKSPQRFNGIHRRRKKKIQW